MKTWKLWLRIWLEDFDGFAWQLRLNGNLIGKSIWLMASIDDLISFGLWEATSIDRLFLSLILDRLWPVRSENLIEDLTSFVLASLDDFDLISFGFWEATSIDGFFWWLILLMNWLAKVLIKVLICWMVNLNWSYNSFETKKVNLII